MHLWAKTVCHFVTMYRSDNEVYQCIQSVCNYLVLTVTANVTLSSVSPLEVLPAIIWARLLQSSLWRLNKGLKVCEL